MKTTATLRILFTAAILAGMAAAPAAQVFTWEPNRPADIRDRVRISIDRARARAERRADQIQRQVQRRIDQQIRRRIQNEVRWNRSLDRMLSRVYPRGASRAFSYGDNAGAQVGTDADPCRDRGYGDDDYSRHCEVRESTMPAGALDVDAGQNGGIVIEGWDRNEIRVRAVVHGSARQESRARDIAGQVRVHAGGGRVYATGPDRDNRREWWSVSYRINVPRKNDLDLRAMNGGITIVGVTGNMRFDTTNGGVRLQDVGGRVNGSTRNGGVNVMLSGDRWDGEGLDVETSNGGVTVAIPDRYNAEFETRTVNGGLRIDFPITVQGELTSRRGISTTLGSGGPLVRARTTNGGVKVVRR